MADLIDDIGSKKNITTAPAKRKQMCRGCKSEASYFRDKASRDEYLYTNLCQRCQDEVFDIGFDADEELETLRHEFPN